MRSALWKRVGTAILNADMGPFVLKFVFLSIYSFFSTLLGTENVGW